MQRVIDLQGCHNFRDLGGYPTEDGRRVRWRRVFRADGLHLLTAADVDRLRREIGLRDVVDLRSTAERRADPPRPLDREEEIHIHHLPLFDGDTRRGREESRVDDMTLADRYLGLIQIASRPIGRVLEIIAHSPGAVVYHCAAGKDRTGVVSAVLLELLGVRSEVIIADYAATKENLEKIIDRLMSTRGYEAVLETLPPDTLHAEPATMASLLEAFRREYGSAAEYLRAAAVTDESIDRLRANLLEDA